MPEADSDLKSNTFYRQRLILKIMNDSEQTERKRPFGDSISEYEGYTLDRLNPSIDRVESNITAKEFFLRYISKRRPCILFNQSTPILSAQLICQVAGDCEVQVEKRKDPNQAYGQNRSDEYQVSCKINEFWKHLKNENDRELYYLSTQQSDEVFSTPCRQLHQTGHIPGSLDWAGSLVLQSCNLWWGASKESSSGLHHDFHDNFYLVQSGVKRFRLFPPSCKIAVYGEIEKIHPNGLISYRSNPTRADGFPVSKRMKSDESDSDGDEKEEGQVFFGKGFDYESDNSHDPKDDENDDYDDLVRDERSEDASEDDDCDESADTKVDSAPSANSRPDNFSPLCPDEVDEPGLTLEVRAGECLYLPCGWFHHVTSLRDSSDCHMAVNYWYHPPDRLDSFVDPYFHRRELCLSEA